MQMEIQVHLYAFSARSISRVLYLVHSNRFLRGDFLAHIFTLLAMPLVQVFGAVASRSKKTHNILEVCYPVDSVLASAR